MKKLTFSIDCIECGGTVDRVNGAQQSRWSVCCVVRCSSCACQYVVDARLTAMPKDPTAAERKRTERARAKANA